MLKERRREKKNKRKKKKEKKRRSQKRLHSTDKNEGEPKTQSKSINIVHENHHQYHYSIIFINAYSYYFIIS